MVKYEARIFDTRERSGWREFWLGDSIIIPPRWRIDLYKIYGNGEETEVKYKFVRFRRNIPKVAREMVESQRIKFRNGHVGTIKLELDV